MLADYITPSGSMDLSTQLEARFVDVDMIVDELEEMEEDEEEHVTSDEIEEKIEEVAYCNVANKFICLFVGIIIGYCLGVMCV